MSANLTLTTLSAAISAAGGPNYTFTDIAPADDQDGGQPGGNIRVAYLYKANLVRLYKPNPGGALDANEVLSGPSLKYNPGRIDPANEAWTASRKPLVAQWEVIGKTRKNKPDVFFTVNVHFGSKGGSSSLHGDARPPVNGGVGKFMETIRRVRQWLTWRPVEDRLEQSRLTANFIKVRSEPPGGSMRRCGAELVAHSFPYPDPTVGNTKKRHCCTLEIPARKNYMVAIARKRN